MITGPKRVSSAGLVMLAVAVMLQVCRLSRPQELSAENGPIFLSMGDDSYITWSEVESRTGALIRREPGDAPLADFSLLILSNISFTSLPDAVRDGIRNYLEQGGSLLITGGKQSFGSGGYAGTELVEVLPLRPTRDDWLPHAFGPTLILQATHPILNGVEIPTMAFFNELDLNVGAVEIARYIRRQRLPHPLIAERSVGGGTILAIALDMTLTGEWRDRDRFTQNCLEYLLQRSRIEPPKKRSDPYQGVTGCCVT